MTPLAGLLFAALGGAGCGSTQVHAPVLTVVTSLYPLAEAVSEVGGAQVHVVDLARPDTDPRTVRLSAGQIAAIRKAALVVDIGGGFQPSVEAAARAARHTLSLLPTLGGTNPYVWLDPSLMQRADTAIRAALTRAEPAARSVFANGAEDLAAELSSLDIDFQNSLSVCPDSAFVTSDDAFARLAKQYGVVDRVAGASTEPNAAQVRAAAAAITASHSVTAFAEPYVSSLTISAAASAAGVKVGILDTIETPPATGSRAEVSYSNLMEVDLKALTTAMQCPSTDQN